MQVRTGASLYSRGGRPAYDPATRSEGWLHGDHVRQACSLRREPQSFVFGIERGNDLSAEGLGVGQVPVAAPRATRIAQVGEQAQPRLEGHPARSTLAVGRRERSHGRAHLVKNAHVLRKRLGGREGGAHWARAHRTGMAQRRFALSSRVVEHGLRKVDVTDEAPPVPGVLADPGGPLLHRVS